MKEARRLGWFMGACLLLAGLTIPRAGNATIQQGGTTSSLAGSYNFETNTGWQGTWTRRGSSNVYDATYLHTSSGQRITTVEEVTDWQLVYQGWGQGDRLNIGSSHGLIPGACYAWRVFAVDLGYRSNPYYAESGWSFFCAQSEGGDIDIYIE